MFVIVKPFRAGYFILLAYQNLQMKPTKKSGEETFRAASEDLGFSLWLTSL